jgi:lysophospholipase L1-like esterase
MLVAARAGWCAALLGGSVVLGLLLAEATVRAYDWSQGHPLLGDAPFLVSDPELGWRPNGDLSVERALVDASGTPYRARVTTGRDGFRRFPDANGRRRILIIGDSFTHAVEVSDERAYWAVFARRHPDHAVFAIGAGGYGTLQEALLLARVGPRVQPNIVIWQFCDNDLTNNLFEAERRSTRHNNLTRRPYWEDAIVYHNPAPWPFALMGRWYQATGLRGLKIAQVHAHRLLRALHDQTDEDGFAGAGGPALRARAIAVTKTILRRSQAGPATHLSFHACQSGGDDFRAISGASGLYFLGDYGPQIAARRSEIEVFAGDGRHLNEHGHALLGDLLAADFAGWLGHHRLGVRPHGRAHSLGRLTAARRFEAKPHGNE